MARGLTLILCCAIFCVACAEDFPFIAVRNMGAGAKNPRFTQAIFAANEKYPGLVDEIWFGGCSPYGTASQGDLVASQLEYRAECEKRGIRFSLQQGPTLGYDGQRTAPPGLHLPDDAWAMTPDGRRHPGVFCPTSPEARELNLKSTKALIGGLKPYSYWPDDDLRLSKRGNRICFCDRCVNDFNRRTGRNLTRAQLERALYGKPGDKSVRADWIAHNCQVLAAFASVYREAADAVFPECRLGLQHMNSDAERYSCEYSGGTPKPILEALRGKLAPQVGYRPGYAFYNERQPLDMFRKAYDIMVSTTEAAKFGFVDRMCHEAENWPHMAAEKNPNTQMVESALALAAGCNSLALYWGSDHYGEEEPCWQYYFDCLARWKPFFQTIVEAAKGTVPSGIATFRGRDRYAGEGWLKPADGTELRLMENSLPIACAGGDVGAWYLSAEGVASLAEEDLAPVFSKAVLMDVSTWSALLRRFPRLPSAGQVSFDDSSRAGEGLLTVGADVEVFPGGYRSSDLKRAIRPRTKEVRTWSSVLGNPDLCGTCSFPSGFGGTVILAQQAFSWYAWTGPKRKAVLDALDAAAPKRFSVRLMTGGYRTVLFVRADAEGRAGMVFLVNPTCGETPPLELRVPGRSADWCLRTVDRTLDVEEVGPVPGGTVIRIPSLAPWQPLLLRRRKGTNSNAKAQRTIGEPVLGSDILKGCEVSAFGAKLLDGATYVEDAYLKTSPKWVNQAVKIDGVVAKLADGREVTLVWQTGKAENPKDPALRYDTPFFAVPYDSDGHRIERYSGYVAERPVYFIKGVEAQFTEVSRRAIRYSKKPMNFVFAHRWSNGEISLRHSIGRHTRDERHVSMYSPDNGQTWDFDPKKPIGSSFMSFETKDGRRRSVGCWHMYAKAATNEFMITVSTLEKDGSTTTRKTPFRTPWPAMCGMHRDVQRLSDGRLIAEAWGRVYNKPGNEAGGYAINYFLESKDDGETWQYLSQYPYEEGHTEGLFESTLVERRDGSLLAICRTGYSLDGSTRHPLLQFISHDGGKTWGERREISDNGVAPQATILADGTLVVLSGRPTLFLLIDRTGTGEHYEKLTITRARTSAYASLVELKPGRIAVFFDESAFIHAPGDTPDNRIMQVEYDYR